MSAMTPDVLFWIRLVPAQEKYGLYRPIAFLAGASHQTCVRGSPLMKFVVFRETYYILACASQSTACKRWTNSWFFKLINPVPSSKDTKGTAPEYEQDKRNKKSEYDRNINPKIRELLRSIKVIHSTSRQRTVAGNRWVWHVAFWF